MTLKPIAIIHVFYWHGREVEFEYHYPLSVPWAVNYFREQSRRFYIEWLDRHNPREVTNESEAGDE